MKHLKMLCLVTVAAMFLMALVGAGTASAGGVLCSTTTNPCTSKWAVPTTLDFSLSSGGSVTFATLSSTTLATCTTSTAKGPLENNPAASGEATGSFTELTFGNCTKPITTIAPGGPRINQIAGTSNGTVIADKEIRWTFTGLFTGENCVYGVAAGVSLGTLTEGNPAVFDVNAVASKTEPAGDTCFFGPSSAKWTATYTLTSPSGTTLSVSSS